MADAGAKALWRKRYKEIRAAIPVEERAGIDERIACNVAVLPEYAAADTVFAYLSFGAEVETRGIIERAWADGKTVLLPRCVPGTREMAWYRVNSFDGLVTSRFGVDEPAEDPTREVDPASVAQGIVLVPGLTFDGRGYRLGYGGGFYDVFLSRTDAAHIATAGLCRSRQLCDRVEVADPHDLPVQLVVTETDVVRVAEKAAETAGE